MSWFGQAWARVKNVWRMAKTERATPRQIGWAVGVGVYSGCTPAPGFHGGIAVGLATIFRLNRLFAWIGSRISAFFIYPWIVIGEVEIAHKLRTGEWVAIDRDTAVARAGELVLDWILGSIPVGLLLGTIVGLAAYGWARRRAARKAPTSDSATAA